MRATVTSAWHVDGKQLWRRVCDTNDCLYMMTWVQQFTNTSICSSYTAATARCYSIKVPKTLSVVETRRSWIELSTMIAHNGHTGGRLQ